MKSLTRIFFAITLTMHSSIAIADFFAFAPASMSRGLLLIGLGLFLYRAFYKSLRWAFGEGLVINLDEKKLTEELEKLVKKYEDK